MPTRNLDKTARRVFTTSDDCDDYEEFHFDEKKKNSVKGSFDLTSWIQQGGVCRNSCRNQVDYEVRHRATSFSSNTFTTEDNSSLNDSFEDDLNESLEGLKLDNIHWNQKQDRGNLNTLTHHQYSSSEESFQSLDISRLRSGGVIDKYNSRFQPIDSTGASSSINKPRTTIPFSPKKSSHSIYLGKNTNIKTRRNTADTDMPQRGNNKREWRSAIDPKSGRRYYYDVHTRQTQWQKPLELASKSERRAIEEKERKQRDFFSAMEKNILNCMQSGQVPGAQVSEQEDTVESLPKPKGSTRRNRPKLLRTISSMDHELLKELTNDIENCNKSSSSPRLSSPGSLTTDFFNSLPQPGYPNNVDDNISSSVENLSSPLDSVPSIASTCASSSSSFDKEGSPSTSKSLPKPSLSKRNTCGTMYVASTMADPDKDAAIKCVCGVYRTHIIQSINDSIYGKCKFAEYEVFNDVYDVKAKKKSTLYNRKPASIVEADFGIEMTLKSRESDVPSLDEISDFFRFIFNKAQMESDCIIMSLIYVERLLRETNGGVRPNLDNWKSLLFSCMIMASKVWDDLSMWNVDFSQACPVGVCFSLKRINELELAVLSCLKYNVKVPASEYAKYYFLMRSMLIRSGLAGEEFRSSPLDLEGAKKLEFLTASYNAKPVVPSSLRRSKSLGDGEKGDGDSPKGIPSAQVKLEQVVQM